MSVPAIMLVVGTRPEAIKLAPLAAALRICGHTPLLVLTGQHSQLDPVSFGLGAGPSLCLAYCCMAWLRNATRSGP